MRWTMMKIFLISLADMGKTYRQNSDDNRKYKSHKGKKGRKGTNKFNSSRYDTSEETEKGWDDYSQTNGSFEKFSKKPKKR